MTSTRQLLILSLALCLLAGGLRFLRLGDWPFHGDELATLEEARSLVEGPTGAANSQTNRLPRLIPLSYLLLDSGYELFGRNEFGSRVLPALLGALHVLLVFLLLDRPLGRIPALATALLIAVWPEHLYRSQENRFYMPATLFASLCMLAGAQAVQRCSLAWVAAACLAALAALLAHTIEGLLLGVLFLSIVATAWLGREPRLVRLLPVVVISALIGLGIFAGYLLPLARGWNAGQSWGYSLAHSVLASVSQLGWPIALLAVLGAVSIWTHHDSQGWYWATWAGVWLGISVLLPFFVSYHPAYVFPLTLGAVVLAGRAIGLIYEGLRAQNALAAVSWLGLACLMNFPSLVSHYADGSRLDYRSAAAHLAAHWQPGDRVIAFSPRLLQHYAPPDIEPVGLGIANPLADIKKLTHSGERLWIVVASSRAGKPELLARWLGANCSQELSVCKKRFDYYENVTEVFLYEPFAPGGVRVAREER